MQSMGNVLFRKPGTVLERQLLDPNKRFKEIYVPTELTKGLSSMQLEKYPTYLQAKTAKTNSLATIPSDSMFLLIKSTNLVVDKTSNHFQLKEMGIRHFNFQ